MITIFVIVIIVIFAFVCFVLIGSSAHIDKETKL